MMLAGKIGFLLLFAFYSVPVLIGGCRGNTVHNAQTFLWAIGLVGFVTIQWLA